MQLVTNQNCYFSTNVGLQIK